MVQYKVSFVYSFVLIFEGNFVGLGEVMLLICGLYVLRADYTHPM